MRNSLVKLLSATLILLYTGGIFLSGASPIVSDASLSDLSQGPTVSTCGVSSVLAVVCSSFSEQLKMITDFTCLGSGVRGEKKLPDAAGKKQRQSDTQLLQTVSPLIQIKPQSLRTASSTVSALPNKEMPANRLAVLWLVSFLSLFWLRKLRFFYALPRGCIDDIMGRGLFFASLATLSR